MLKDNILDTLIFKNKKIYLKEFHLERTKEAFGFLNIIPDLSLTELYDKIEKEISEKINSDEVLRIIFSVNKPGSYYLEIKKITPLGPLIKLNPVHTTSSINSASQFKWQNRVSWENLLSEKKSADADDILLINSENLLTETSRFNVFCYNSHKNIIYTPALTCGCLNGVFRRSVLSNGEINLPDIGKIKIIEKNILESEIMSYQLYVGNSVRGLLMAEIVS